MDDKDTKPTMRKSVRFASSNKSDNCTSKKSNRETSKKSVQSAPKTNIKSASQTSIKSAPKTNIKSASQASVKSAPKTNIKSASKTSIKSAPKNSIKGTPKISIKGKSKKSSRGKSKTRPTPKKGIKKRISKSGDDENIKPVEICQYCDLNTTSMNHILNKSVTDKSVVYNFLCEHGVVVNSYKCLKCGRNCHLNLTGKLFICNKSVINSNNEKQFCNYKVSVFKSTFFYKARLSHIKAFEFVYLYFFYPVKGRSHVIIKDLSIGPNTFTDWANFVREVLEDYSERHSQPIGGKNVIVEIAEIKFSANKCNRFGGIPDQWVLAGVERDNKSKHFIIAMQKNDIENVSIILKQYVKPESIVHCSVLESFQDLGNTEYHRVLDHEVSLVCLGTEDHIQNANSLLRDIRYNIPEFGQKSEHFNGYLAEARFRVLFKRPGERFHHFWRATGVKFPPMA